MSAAVAASVDPLAVACSYCGAERYKRCVAKSHAPPFICYWARKPHARRRQLALILAADADPALDQYFPKRGQCGLCGTPGLDQRHRVVDAVADALRAEPDAEEELAADYGLSLAAVETVREWAARWEA